MRWTLHKSILAAVLSLAAAPDITASWEIAAMPDWSIPRDVTVPETVPHSEVQDGIYHVLIDEHDRVQSHERFTRMARLITSETGVQNGAEFLIDYAPAFQSVRLHEAKVFRNGEWHHRLSRDIVQELQREQSLEHFMVGGVRTLVVRLPDIRIGDFILVAYTREGSNPVMQGHFYRKFLRQWTVPVYELHYRLEMPPGLAVQARSLPQNAEPVLEPVFEWSASQVPALRLESDIPEWLDILPAWEITSWQSWPEVVAWALPMYEPVEDLPEEILALLDACRTLPDPAAVVSKLLRFVQDEVRYLANFEGIHSHQPRPPHAVMLNRFGDCKEKVLLLHSMLHALDIKSHPVFVSTSRIAEGHLPMASPYAFDHVILAVELWDTILHLDPTRTHQRGPLQQIYIPDYGYGLPILEGSGDLRPVRPLRTSIGKTVTKKDYQLADLHNASASGLSVTTTYTGLSAENMRRVLQGSSRQQLQEGYLSYYAQDHPAITTGKELQILDNEEENTIVVSESYDLPRFWQARQERDEARVLIPHRGLYSQMSVPARLDREWPYRLYNIVPYEIASSIQLPLQWPSHSSKVDVQNQWFDFEYGARISGDRAEITGKFHPLAESVSASDMAEFRSEVERAMESVGYEFTHGLTGAPGIPASQADLQRRWLVAGGLVTIMAISAGLAGIAAMFIFRKNRRQPPRPLTPALAHLDGIGGWLIVVAFILGLWCFGFMRTMAETIHEFGTNPASLDLMAVWRPHAQPGFAAIMVLDAIGYGIIFTTLLTAIVFFCQRSRYFRHAFLFMLIFPVPLYLTSALIAHWLQAGEEYAYRAGELIGRAIIPVCIWTPYILISKRVEATFRH